MRLTLFFTLFVGALLGQGTIRGEVVDLTTGEKLPFVKVKVEGQNQGALTDFEGAFNLKINAGTYNLIFTVAEYDEIKQEVIVKDKEVTLANAQLQKHVQEIKGDFKVIAYRQTASSIAGDDVRRREAVNATDGMTKEQMKSSGDNDAGMAIQRVPGVSVQDGKHVYVRGLGDRYTKTILNGMEIPGLDPDRNTVQLDIFPTTLIDNITVYKTFTPNLSGDFTGGLVNIITKEFPSKKELNFSAGIGYNSTATFKSNFLTYKGGKFDYFAFDDGTRAMPLSPTTKIPDPVLKDEILTKYTKSFVGEMAPSESTALMNHNYAISLGDQVNKLFGWEKIDYGYNAAFGYRNNYTFFENIEYGEFWKSTNSNETELEAYRTSKGSIAQNDIIWTALLGQSFKINKTNKISLTGFHTQNGQTTTSQMEELNFVLNPAVLVKNSLQYTQRQISNVNLNGAHMMNKFKLNWAVAPTISKISDPDIRSTILEKVTEKDENGVDVVTYELNQAVGAEIRRMYRELNEKSINGKLDMVYEFNQWDSLASKVSFGGAYTMKHRTFNVYDYFFLVDKPEGYNQDPNWYFEPENIWTVEKNRGTYVRGQKEPANNFEGTQQVIAGYAMHELPLSENFDATYGVRMEMAQNHYTGENNSGTQKFVDSLVLNEVDFLPSLNLVYKIKDETKRTHTNLRAAYSSTVARPSFREKSIAQIYDPILGRRYNGNIDLKETHIHNADLRWEYFYGKTELVSISGFYKRFIDPIEIASFDVAPNEVKPVNAGEANLYGAELEFRKAIGFAKESQEHLSLMVGANFNYVVSQINLNKVMVEKGDQLISEKEMREANKREGETISDFRPMYGQSPYAINAFVTFSNEKKGVNVNLSYNVQGKRLAVIGVGLLPDVYEQAFHSLNFKASKSFGKQHQWMMNLSAQNLLMNTKKMYYESFEAEAKVYNIYNPGVNVSGGISYTIK